MTELCKRCHQALKDSDKTLFGKQYKTCSTCRAAGRIHQQDFSKQNPEYYSSQHFKDNQEKHITGPKRKRYQDFYRSFMRCPYRSTSIKKDFVVCFN